MQSNIPGRMQTLPHLNHPYHHRSSVIRLILQNKPVPALPTTLTSLIQPLYAKKFHLPTNTHACSFVPKFYYLSTFQLPSLSSEAVSLLNSENGFSFFCIKIKKSRERKLCKRESRYRSSTASAPSG